MSSPGHRANIVDPRPAQASASASCSARPSRGTTPLFVTQLFTN